MLIYLGYFFTVINYICYCSSRFVREKKWILTLDLIAKVFTIAGLYCLGSMSGALSFIIEFLILIVANIKERRAIGKAANTLLYLVFAAAYVVILVTTFAGISSLLVFASCIITCTSNWWLPPQKMRIVGGFNSFIYLSYQLSIRNWAGLIEILVIISNFASFARYHKEGR